MNRFIDSMCIYIAVLKSPKNVRNKKVWTHQYYINFRKKVAYPQTARTKTSLLSAGGILTRETLFLEQNYIQMRKRPSFDYFYFRHGYVDLWWGRRRRTEWMPALYPKWRYHYNTYSEVAQNWSTHRVDSFYQNFLNRFKAILPTFTHSLLNWLVETLPFKQFVFGTTKVLEFIDSSTTTFKAKFQLLWGTPASLTTPKKFVRWFFGKRDRELLVQSKVVKSLNTSSPNSSRLMSKLNDFKKKK